MKLGFKISNVIKFIVAILLIVYEVYMIYVFLFESPEIESTLELFMTLGIAIGALYVTMRYAISNIIPKYFKAMRVVNKFITFNELKDCICNESFIPVDLPSYIIKTIKKSTYKNFSKSLLISENWVYADKVMIPKKMIVAVGSRPLKICYTPPHFSIMYFLLANGRKYEFGDTSYDAELLTEYLNKGKEINNIKYITHSDKYIENFKNKIKTKEEFLKFIR